MSSILTMNKIKITPLFVRHDFRLFDPSSYLSLLIRVIIGFWANHVAIKYESEDFAWVVESRSGGVMKVTWENWLKHRPYKQWVISKELEIEEYKVNIRLGIAYDVASLFEHLRYRITHNWIGDKSPREENCSELLADLLDLPDAYSATPKSLYEYLNNGKIFDNK